MDNILYKVNFPAEFHAQTAAEAAIKLSKKLSGKIDEITKIEIQTQEPGVRIISKKGPLKNYADRDHCIEYIVAWCLINGSLDANSYDDVSASNPKIDQLRDLTSTHENQSYTNRYYDLAERAIPNSVTVKLGSGEIFTEEVIYPLGHRNRREESKPFLGAKFEKSLKKSNLDKSFLLDAYKNEAIDKVEIYDILTKIYK
jgi:2-methylcitrate dehydratase